MKLAELFAEANAQILAECEGFVRPVKTARDINNGFCETWAEYVCERLPGARLIWIDELSHNCKPEGGECHCAENNRIPAHCVVKYRGKLYDAECHEGVKNWRKLPIELNKGKSREEGN